MNRYTHALGITVAAWLGLAAPLGAAPGDDKAGELLTMIRAALGGEKLEKVNGLSASGEFRRVFGQREMSGEMTLDLAAPDKIKRTEEMGLQGGPTFSRTVALAEGTFWEDSTNRGGGGFMMRFGGPGAQGGPPREPTEEERARFRQMQQRRLEGDLQRYLLMFLLRSNAPVRYAGVAEAADGKAEVLEFTPEGSVSVKVRVPLVGPWLPTV